MAISFTRKDNLLNVDLRDETDFVPSFFESEGKGKTVPPRFFPSEWYPQSGIQIAWPHIDSDWKYIYTEIEEFYIKMTYEIASREPLLIVTPDVSSVRNLLTCRLPQNVLSHVVFANIATNDTWSRDNSFLSVINKNQIELLDFCFNGWGQKFDGEKDNEINKQLIEKHVLKGKYCDLNDFVLEGGSIESDGKGTILTTSNCLLSPYRNPKLSQDEITEKLKSVFSVEQILWLNNGHLEGDDTDGHIDTLARFCPNDTIVYVKCDNQNDVHYDSLSQMEKELQSFRTTEGRPYNLVSLPLPDAIYADVQTGELVAGDSDLSDGIERLPATYANFLIMNKAVLYPTYNQEEKDLRVKRILQKVFPNKEIVGLDCRVLIKQHGSLHCSTMQFPIGVM